MEKLPTKYNVGDTVYFKERATDHRDKCPTCNQTKYDAKEVVRKAQVRCVSISQGVEEKRKGILVPWERIDYYVGGIERPEDQGYDGTIIHNDKKEVEELFSTPEEAAQFKLKW